MGQRRLHRVKHTACRLHLLSVWLQITSTDTAICWLCRIHPMVVRIYPRSACLIIFDTSRLTLTRFPSCTAFTHSKPTQRTLICQISYVLGGYYSSCDSIIVYKLVFAPRMTWHIIREVTDFMDHLTDAVPGRTAIILLCHC